MSEIIIRRMLISDTPTLIDSHISVFPNYNTTKMGKGYLKALYKTLAIDYSCISIVAIKNNNIVGWIGGVWDRKRYNNMLIINSIIQAPKILYSVIREKLLLIKIIKFISNKLFYSFIPHTFIKSINKKNNQSNSVHKLFNANLLVIGVIPDQKRKGIGSKLISTFHKILILQGFTQCTLSTKIENKEGNASFVSMGYQKYLVSDESNRYIINLYELFDK